MKYDVEIGGLPFLFATNQQNQYRRETADFRRQRVDQEREVGEQSLDSGYWLRSQASFHMGAGISSTEPLSVPESEARFRYAASSGVDPWTPGELKLLHDTDAAQALDPGEPAGCLGLGDALLSWSGSDIYKTVVSGSSFATSSVTNPFSGSALVRSATTTGGDAIIAGATQIAKAPAGLGSAPSLIYSGASSITVARWLKQRLIVANGQKLHEVTNLSPASVGAMPTEFYTHPAGSWVWSDAAEGPEAIYVSGYSNDTSSIYAITITDNAGVLDLGTPTLVVDMPRGENVMSLYSYLGSYLIVGTNKGVRVAQIRQGGTLVLGPILVDHAGASGSMDAVAQGRYVWVSNGGDYDNLWRIDLGQPLNGELRFAVAADLHHVDDAAVSGVTTFAGLLWFTADTGVSATLIREVGDKYRESGWLETGRIRMGTLQPKAWREATLMRVPDANYVNSMEARLKTASEADGPWTAAVSLGPADPVANKSEVGSITAPSLGPDLFVRIELQPTLSGANIQKHTPVVTGYQVSSIPAPARSRLVSVPLQCWDWERDRNGKVGGRDGYSWSRLSALESLESDAAVVTYKDLTTDEIREAYIERVTFTRLTPPFRGEGNDGGVASVLLRLVA